MAALLVGCALCVVSSVFIFLPRTRGLFTAAVIESLWLKVVLIALTCCVWVPLRKVSFDNPQMLAALPWTVGGLALVIYAWIQLTIRILRREFEKNVSTVESLLSQLAKGPEIRNPEVASGCCGQDVAAAQQRKCKRRSV